MMTIAISDRKKHAAERLLAGEKLLKDGLLEEAKSAFLDAGHFGLPWGYVRVAEIEDRQGRKDRARSWMSKVELLAENGDADANLGCHLAYQSWYGEGTLEEQNKKANHFLLRSAELGNVTAQNILAVNKLQGNNDEAEDLGAYHKWISLSIDGGNIDALIGHCERSLEYNWDISEKHIKLLEIGSSQSRRLKNLYNKLLRRAKRSLR